MPYRSERQRRFMHARHPDIAARWDAKYGTKVKAKKKSSAKSTKRAKSKKRK